MYSRRFCCCREWGSRPLVKNGAADISLRHSAPGELEIWELAANGLRVRRMASAVVGGHLCFTATVAGPDGARMIYEIVNKSFGDSCGNAAEGKCL